MVQRVGEQNADRRVPLEPVARVDLVHDGVGIYVLSQEPGPRCAVALHDRAEIEEVRAILVVEVRGFAGKQVEVPGIVADHVAHCLEDRAIGAGHGCRQLLRAEPETGIDQPERRPDVVGECVFEQRPSHWVTLPHVCPAEKGALS